MVGDGSGGRVGQGEPGAMLTMQRYGCHARWDCSAQTALQRQRKGWLGSPG